MSEMLTEMVPGQEDSSDLELLQVSFLENMILIPSVLLFLWGVCSQPMLGYMMDVGCA